MNFNSFIKPILKDSVATVLTASRNCYGDITKNAVDQGDLEYSVVCRFTEQTKYIWGATGVQETIRAQMWTDLSASINEGYFIIRNNKEYEVSSVETKYGLNGRPLFKKVMLR